MNRAARRQRRTNRSDDRPDHSRFRGLLHGGSDGGIRRWKRTDVGRFPFRDGWGASGRFFRCTGVARRQIRNVLAKVFSHLQGDVLLD